MVTDGWTDDLWTRGWTDTDGWTNGCINGWTKFLSNTDAIDAPENDNFPTELAFFYKRMTDQRSNQQTDRPTDGPTDQQTVGHTLI